MTKKEKLIADCLLPCRFLPGSFDKKFVKGLPARQDKPMTPNGRKTMMHLFHKYKDQIHSFHEVLRIILKD